MEEKSSSLAEDKSLERHQLKCSICRHPHRQDIEEDFIHWGDVWSISKYYDIPDYRSIYRHVAATGLILRRRENLFAVLDRIVENVSEVTVTASNVLSAIRAYSCLDDRGRWTDPPRRVVATISGEGNCVPSVGRGTQSGEGDSVPSAERGALRSPASAAPSPADQNPPNSIYGTGIGIEAKVLKT